jgi:hypothetical protein
MVFELLARFDDNRSIVHVSLSLWRSLQFQFAIYDRSMVYLQENSGVLSLFL